jgi:hypothetical protein
MIEPLNAQDKGRIFFTSAVGPDKVLLRWIGAKETDRFYGYNIHRREADSSTFVTLNASPIIPLTDTAKIRAIFEAPNEGQILADIQSILGPAYYNEIIKLRTSGDKTDLARLAILVNTNYGVSISEGLGFLDKSVTNGIRYTYELWGVNNLGIEIERLGKVSVVGGIKTELDPPTLIEWVPIIGPAGDKRVYLRWVVPPSSDLTEGANIGFGYDIYRMEGGLPPEDPYKVIKDTDISAYPKTYLKVNKLPVVVLPAQNVDKGRELFSANCSNCHTRNEGEIFGKGTREFNGSSKQSAIRAHSINVPSDLDLESVFNYINDFFFMDDNSFAGRPFEYDNKYTYWVVARDLLRQHGKFSIPVLAEIRDKIPPKVPYNVQTTVTGNVPNQKIKITWDKNMNELPEGPGAYVDDTVTYKIYRRFGDTDATKTYIASVAQPSSGIYTVEYTDVSISKDDWGKIYWYHITALDVAGNESPFSAQAKGVVYDLQPPSPPYCKTPCEEINYQKEYKFCREYSSEQELPTPLTVAYVNKPDDSNFPEFRCTITDTDTEGIKVYRSIDGVNFYFVKDLYTTGQNYIDFIDDAYKPRVSQEVYYKFKAFDENNNVSGFTTISSRVLVAGEPPPAPIITGMKHITSSMAPDGIVDTVDILISVLNPDGVAGFKLYRASTSEGTGAYPLIVDPSPNSNWGRATTYKIFAGVPPTIDVPVKYGITLSRLPAGGMEDDNSKVTFDQDKRYYILRAKNVPSPSRGKYYAVTALDFAGQESDRVFYYWSGDDISVTGRNLPWPSRDLRKVKTGTLTLSFRPANQTPEKICLNWEVNGKIADENNEIVLPYLYYVVFRVRGNPNPDRFVQVSRLLTGPFNATQSYGYDPDEYCDRDVMPGETYTYVVLGIKKDNYSNALEDEKMMDSNHGEIAESFGPVSIEAR